MNLPESNNIDSINREIDKDARLDAREIFRQNECFSWWRSRWRIFRSPRSTVGGKFWAVAEIFCAALTILTLTFAVGLLLIRVISPVSIWLTGWPLQIALAGAVGYGTNFIAVQMLFKPRKPITSIPLRWIWKQGLVPAKQKDMAVILGDEIAGRLLTPETMVDEFARVVDLTLNDHFLPQRIQAVIIPFTREQLPEFIERFMPDLLEAVRQTIQENLPVARVKEILLDVVEKWFNNEENRVIASDFLLDFLSNRTHPVIELIKTSVTRYQKSSKLRDFAFKAGEAVNIINWPEFELALQQQLKKNKSQRVASRVVEDFSGDVGNFIDAVVTTEWLTELKHDAGRSTLASLQGVIAESLIPRVVDTVNSEDFHRFVREELIPKLKPKLVAWLKNGYLAQLMGRFDVKGRIADAAAMMDARDLEDMTNRVGAYHLGAIQVLGYIFGLLAGVLMVMINNSNGIP